MTGRRAIELPLDLIEVGERLRKTDQAHVELLKRSMERSGLRTPIEVTEPDSAGRHRLIFGAHRLEAARQLGWAKIEAFVAEVDDVERQLREIEENLVRHDLSELDRAMFLAKWKELYLGTHPDARRGGDRRTKATNLSVRSPGFARAVEERLRLTPRSIERAVKRASLIPELREALAGHAAAGNGSILDALVRLGEDDQAHLAQDLRAHPEMPPAELRKRAAQLRGVQPPGRPSIFAKLVLLWEKASADEKAKFRQHIAPRSGRGEP